MNRELFLIRGIPGSGKSTLAKSLGGKHIEADMFFTTVSGKYEFDATKIKDAHSWCQNMVGSWMSDDEQRIVVSNTFTQEWELQFYYDWAKEFDYKVFSLIVENRHSGENLHNVPQETLSKMRNRFEIRL